MLLEGPGTTVYTHNQDRLRPLSASARKNSLFSFIPKRLSFGKGRSTGLIPKKATLTVFHEEAVSEALLEPDVHSGLTSEEILRLPPNERALARVLNRRPTTADMEEYYFEDLNPTTIPMPKSTLEEKLRSCSGSRSPESRTESGGNIPLRFLSLVARPVEWIGRGTLLLGATAYHLMGGQTRGPQLPEEMNRPVPEQEQGHLSDLMISTIAGIAIAALIVFPALRLLGHEVYATIAKSTVRKIGNTVTIDRGQDSSILLPLVTEQFLFPKTSEVEKGSGAVPTETSLNGPKSN